MAEYVLSRLAVSDLAQITEYTAENYGVAQARNYTTQIHQSAQIAAEFPMAGRNYTTRNGVTYRQYNCGRHALFYRTTGSGIFIVRILHLVMDFDMHLGG